MNNNSSENTKKHSGGSKLVSVICILLIVGGLSFLLYYHVIEPYLSEQTADRYRDIYYAATEVSNETETPSDSETELPLAEAEGEQPTELTEPEPEPISSSMQWDTLKTYNEDICGWITIPDTNIDYPVVTAADSDMADFYLKHDIDGKYNKNGSIFVDYRTPIRKYSRCIVINGHNMKSNELMFHDLTKYDSMSFYRGHPVFTFNTPEENARWKIFALIKTNNRESQGERYPYYRDNFTSDEEFMQFIYELQVRSIYSYPVTINERDTVLILSTCTYELPDMRLLVIARKVRKGESEDVNTNLAYQKDEVVYPDAWYATYPAVRPEVSSFAEAHRAGELTWYDGGLE